MRTQPLFTVSSLVLFMFQVLMQATLDTTQNLCPKILQKSGIRDQLINAMSERVILQDHLNLSVILDQLVTDVFNKLKCVP